MKHTNSLVLILTAIGLFYMFINPQYQEVKVLSVEADEYKSVLENASAISSVMNGLYERYREFPSAEIERLEKALPDHADAVRLALDLDTMAGNHGISVRDVEVDMNSSSNSAFFEDGYTPPYSKVLVTFRFLSNYQNFQNFLADLEKSLRVTDVRDVSFQISENGLYEHSMTVETYWVE